MIAIRILYTSVSTSGTEEDAKYLRDRQFLVY
jgi:hypothetical protein